MYSYLYYFFVHICMYHVGVSVATQLVKGAVVVEQIKNSEITITIQIGLL